MKRHAARIWSRGLLIWTVVGNLMAGLLLTAVSTEGTQALAQGTSQPLSLLWNIPEQPAARSLAWGDVNNDGDLDLVFGNSGQPSRLYRNCSVKAKDDGCDANSPFVPDTTWVPSGPNNNTRSVALGDINGDGRLDLVLGNNNQPSLIYLNVDGSFLNLADIALAKANTRSVALGDVDGDGRLDLVLGNAGVSQLYLNTGGGFSTPAAWTPASANTRSVALGDVDGDGRLDLVLGNAGVSQLYLNTGGGFSTPAAWTPASANTNSVALGDLDGNGTLDLALGNTNQPSQLYLNAGGGFSTPDAWTPASAATNSVALGDINGDGDLDLVLGNDLVVGNTNQPSQIYSNCAVPDPSVNCNGVTFGAAPIWTAPSTPATFAVALGDIDGNGTLDLAVGNNGQFGQIYRNDSLALIAQSLPDTEQTIIITERRLALGDYDGDSRIDLMIGNYGSNLQLFQNIGAGSVSRVWESSGIVWPKAMAWGDVNNDGDLDLVVGNYNHNQASQIYRNCRIPDPDVVCPPNTPFVQDSTWAPAVAATFAVAWADVDNDGDLDLVVGNENQPSQLYLNNGQGALSLSAWTPAAAPTTSVAWGDVNGDGDLDLVMGNRSTASSRLYRNCTYPDAVSDCSGGVLLVQDTGWTPPPADTGSVAWGDVNGDGNIDLAVGNSNNPSQLYLNDGTGKLMIDAAWQPAPARTQSLAWGDMDGDGDLDLLVGNNNEASQIYWNNGAGRLTLLAATPANADTNAVAWGDMNNDGTLDAVFANANQNADPLIHSQIVLNTRRIGSVPIKAGLIKSGPTVVVRQPETPAADLLATGRILNATIIPITYTLSDNQSDPVAAVAGFYSLDGGGTWRPAATTSTLAETRNLPTAPGAGVTYTYKWDTFSSCFFGQSDTVLFQIRASPVPLDVGALPRAADCGSLPSGIGAAAPSYTNQVSGSFQRPFVSAMTRFFRARGIQVRVMKGATPAPGAQVYRLGSNDEHGNPLAGGDGTPFKTDANGYLSGRGVLTQSDRVAALAPLTNLAGPLAANPAIAFYYTSDIASDTGLPSTQVEKGATSTQVIQVLDTRPLILLNLKVGVEWDASKDEPFQRQLATDLKRASELLYDWSDGQFALGTLDVRYGQEALKQANLRIYATNRLRPSATQGGILNDILQDPLVSTISYEPGTINIGAVWTRYGDSAGLGEDWPRALAHEIGHYALFLDDNYIGRDDSVERQLISIPPKADGVECRGAMSNPYRDDYSEFQPRGSAKDPYAWDANCRQTFSNYQTGRADWETMKAFYDSAGQGFSLRAPTAYNESPGPSAQVLSFTSVKLPATASSPLLISAPIFSLEREDGSRYTYAPGSRVQAFRFTNGDSQIIDLGRPRADQLDARGATIGDTICIYDQSGTVWSSGCTTVAATISPIRIAAAANWQPQITITPIDTAHVRVEIAADGIVTTGAAAPTLRVTLFADAPASGTISADLSLAPDARVYSYTFTTSEAIYNGHLRVQVNGDTAAAGRREIVSEYKVSGSLPVATSLQVGTKTCTCDAPVAATSDGQMLAYGDALGTDEFYSFQSASAVAAAPAWGIFVGQVYNFYTNIPASQIQSKHLYLTAAYLESELPAGTEGGLAIYYSADGTGWKRLPQSRFDPSRNEISSAVVGPGYYALVSRIEVEAGWNLISYPWAEPLDVLAATARLNIVGGTNFTTIHSYEPQDRANPWKVYDVDVPGWVNDLTQLGYSRGYWFIVPLGGGTPTQYATQSLAVGVPVPPAIYYGVLPYHGSGASVGLDVQVLSGNTVCSTSKTFTPIGTKQVAFLIEVLPAGQGAPAGCGINGEPVMIIVGGKLIGQATWDNSRPITFRDTYLPLIFGPPAAPLASAPDAGNPSDTTTTNGATNERWSGQQVP